MSRSAAIQAARAAESAAAEVQANCSSALHYAESHWFDKAAQQIEWAEDNARSMLHRIQEARAAIDAARKGQEGGARG